MVAKLTAGVLADPILVGREGELKQLGSFLNSVLEGKGKTVFVAGEAGSGKTRLTREFLGLARKRGVAVLAGWCISDATIPYFPFIEAFNTYFASLSEDEQLADLQPPRSSLDLKGAAQTGREDQGITTLLGGPSQFEERGKVQAFSPQLWRDQAFAAVVRILHSASVQTPVILLIEDIHWADSASLALLHYIARAICNCERILVLATFRSEELTADTEGHPHPLAETLRAMRREDLFTEMQLSSLDVSNISEIAENMMGGRVQPSLAERLTSEGRGNPLFVVESLRMLHERKSLIRENEEWRLAVGELGIPSKIRDIILRRLAVLNFAQRRVLDAASVVGEKFDVELLSTVLERDVLEVLDTLNVIAQTTSLICVQDGSYRFDHARSRETLYGELSPPLKRGYHARIAEKLESSRSAAPPLSDLSYHYAQAGNKEKALKYALAAGKDELSRFSNQAAIKNFTYALQNLPEGSEGAEQRRIAKEGLGDAYAANNMYAEAIKTFSELAESETGAVQLRALRKAMDASFIKGGDPDLLLDYAKKAEELAAYDRLEMARVLNDRARAFGFAGRGTMKLDFDDYAAALKVFEEENSLADAADALWRCGAVRTIYGDDRGFGEILRSIAIFRELGDTRKEVEATLYLGLSFGEFMLLPEAHAQFAKVIQLGDRIGCFGEVSWAISNLAFELEGLNRIEEALSLQFKALEYWKRTDLEWLGNKLHADIVRLYVKLGDIKEAEKYADVLSKSGYEHSVLGASAINTAKIALTAAKNNWDVDFLEFKKNVPAYFACPNVDFMLKVSPVWFLQKQGKNEQAESLMREAMGMVGSIDKKFSQANLQTNLMMPRTAQVGDEIELRFDLANVSRKPVSIAKIEGIMPSSFSVFSFPVYCSIENGVVSVKSKTIAPFGIETMKLNLKTTKEGRYLFNPTITYIDYQGQMKTTTTPEILLTVQANIPKFEVEPRRITTGRLDLDRLLLGGIPEDYAVALVAPSGDERALIVNRFLRAGVESGEVTLSVTAQTRNILELTESQLPNFFLILCNQHADQINPNQSNVFKLKGVENLTEIDIALTKAFRTLDATRSGHRRACIEIVSEVLIEHHAVTTRKWLTEFLSELRSKGFTTMTVVDSKMHSPEELQAILSVFDGEIWVSEKETAEGDKLTMKIKKLYDQKYLNEEIIIKKEES